MFISTYSNKDEVNEYMRNKNRNRKTWNRKRPDKKIDIPLADVEQFVLKTEVPNVVTLCAEEFFSTYFRPPEEYIKDQLMKRLCDSIKLFVRFEVDDAFYIPDLPDQVRVRAFLKVLE